MPWIHYPLHPELGLRFVPHRAAGDPTPHASRVASTPVSPSPRVERAGTQPEAGCRGEVPSRYFLGLDLGQVSDPTALAVIRQLRPAPSVTCSPPPAGYLSG